MYLHVLELIRNGVPLHLPLKNYDALRRCLLRRRVGKKPRFLLSSFLDAVLGQFSTAFGLSGVNLRDWIFKLLKSQESIPRNQFHLATQLAGQYDNPIPTRLLSPLACLNIPAQEYVESHMENPQVVPAQYYWKRGFRNPPRGNLRRFLKFKIM
jgi:hypothetical protein